MSFEKLLLSGLKPDPDLTLPHIVTFIRAPLFFIFANCNLQFLQFVFHFSQLILNLKSESTVAHRVSHSPFSMEHVCPRMRFLRF